MAINIDRVYQTVLRTANNKMDMEVHITPKDFNLWANQAQKEIFESYFKEEYAESLLPMLDTDYGDIKRNTGEKISVFLRTSNPIAKDTTTNIFAYPTTDFYRLVLVYSNSREVDEVSTIEAIRINRAPHTRPTVSDPIYERRNTGILVYPASIASINMLYLKTPSEPQWVPDTNGRYDNTNSVNFELADSEEQELVQKNIRIYRCRYESTCINSV